MILWGRRRDDPAIVNHREEHSKFNHMHPPPHDSQCCRVALGPGVGLTALQGRVSGVLPSGLKREPYVKTIRCWSMTGTMTVVIKVLSRDRQIAVKMA